MRNGARSLRVVLALCTGCYISSLIIYYDTSSLALRASFLSGLLLNLGQKDNTLSIERKSDGSYNKTSILCWVMTTPERYLSALAVKNTWGKRCDKLIFFGDKLDEKLESVRLSGVREGRNFLWGKTREALKYLYDYYLNDFDWFYKADDDTYVIMENLRYVLTLYDPDFPIGLGEPALVKGKKPTSYLLGGAGYILSRGTLRIYGNVNYHNNSLCPVNDQGGEDVTLGRCLNKSGILLGDTRDELGRHRFHQLPPVDYIKGIWVKWYQDTIIYTYGKGIDSLSETAVSFHDIKDESHLYLIEFFIYRLQLFGVSGRFKGPQIAPLPPDISAIPVQVLKRFRGRRRTRVEVRERKEAQEVHRHEMNS